jgi:hypothetical protein
VPEGPRERRSIVGAAGRTAVALLRSTGHRAKLGSLHLPLALHPSRPEPLLLPIEGPIAQSPPAAPGVPAALLAVECRNLRGKLASAERRNARLRHALLRERLAATRARETLAEPAALIDHLLADLRTAPEAGDEERRRLIGSVLAAYGFRVGHGQEDERPPLVEAASVPRLDWRRQEELIGRIMAAQPEIGSARYVHLVLDALARHPSLTLGQMIELTGLTSPLGRRRLRLALEGLQAEGVVIREGTHCRLTL